MCSVTYFQSQNKAHSFKKNEQMGKKVICVSHIFKVLLLIFYLYFKLYLRYIAYE